MSEMSLAWVVGPTELMMLLVVAIFLFGPKRLPEIGEALGKSIKSFKTASAGDEAKPKSLE